MNLKLQYIEWFDHHSDGEDWVDLEEYAEKPYQPMICRSVGWVVREDECHIALLANLDGPASAPKERNGFGAMILLKSAILRRVTLNPNAPKVK